MKQVNLKSIVSANKGLSREQRDSLYKVWGISPKPQELVAIENLVKKIEEKDPLNSNMTTMILGNCYFGFIIPRISKEFDCLWIGDSTIVNIELKSKDVGADKMERQLLKNRYYLQPLNRLILSFTYESSNSSCYTLDKNNKLIVSDIESIVQALLTVHQENLNCGEITTLFPPERYLVSPFNATDEFLSGRYFLTDQQIDFKDRIIDFLYNNTSENFCAITGGPGSGKTLLLYDIARTLMENKEVVLIGHSGNLNRGHNFLNQNGWSILTTRDLFTYKTIGKRDIKDADAYMIDEAQRCYNLNSIIKEVEDKGKKCVLSFDDEQIMKKAEASQNNGATIRRIAKGRCYALTTNIRTNADVYSFIKALFNKREQTDSRINDHIDITYCRDYYEATVILDLLRNEGYHVPKFTPEQYKKADYEHWFPVDEQSAHDVIGQEFDKVASLLSDKMFYDANGKLVSRGTYYYSEDRMLYQILSRARHKIHLVIVNNPSLLERCTKLINKVD